MAVTKTHPIKSTLKAAIDYICNPDKTDGKLLVSSFGCSAETADIEFAWTRRHAIDKGTNLGRHLIQAFEPGEVTPEEAHRIGMELAREVLGGKYEFVLTTHIDRDHVHNHLIFNAVSFQDHKHYHSNKRSYHFIRRTSDRICKEHGLSVIVPGRDKGKSYIEHQAEQNGTSYKAKLRAAIDRLLPGCSDLEDLLRRLQREGYELKRGKYISARAPGQERFTRLKTLGADYAEEALTARIAGRPRPSRQPQQRTGKPSLLIDIQNNLKAQQSAGYKHWATIENPFLAFYLPCTTAGRISPHRLPRRSAAIFPARSLLRPSRATCDYPKRPATACPCVPMINSAAVQRPMTQSRRRFLQKNSERSNAYGNAKRSWQGSWRPD